MEDRERPKKEGGWSSAHTGLLYRHPPRRRLSLQFMPINRQGLDWRNCSIRRPISLYSRPFDKVGVRDNLGDASALPKVILCFLLWFWMSLFSAIKTSCSFQNMRFVLKGFHLIRRTKGHHLTSCGKQAHTHAHRLMITDIASALFNIND